MALWALAAAVGSAAVGMVSAKRASNQAKARNAYATQQYEQNEEFRKAEWFQQLSVYGARRVKYEVDLTEDDIAAQRGYTQAQVGLNDKLAEAWRRNENRTVKWLQSSGKLTAMGRTGKSIRRMKTLDIGALERSAGREVAALTRNRESFKENVEAIRNKQRSHRNRLYPNVALVPLPGMPTPPPMLESTDPTLGYLSAALSGIATYGSLGGTFGGGGGGTNIQNSANAAWNAGGGSTTFNPGTYYGGSITDLYQDYH